jgi:hypothetical protein
LEYEGATNLAKPLRLHTSGSNIAALNKPVWCSTNTAITVSDFPWNAASGTSLTTAAANHTMILFVQTTAAASYLMQQADLANASPLCEEY